ncbi:hypothetical protein [Novosphingobium sp.]|uniref:hypothetical protein n=1 Tax=Novosphingobium sp. TaxID=1874826 RepID=UPI0025FE7C82|nr:hypothetical protein [Novosphingobium sp.]
MARFANPLYRAARTEKVLSQELIDDALHFVPPSKRELRTQAVHRLQVGLLGLAAILLLIALASAIMQHARQTEDAATLANGGVVARSAVVRPSGGPGDPLADMGVAPEMRAGRAPGAGNATPAPRNPALVVPQDPARGSHTP